MHHHRHRAPAVRLAGERDRVEHAQQLAGLALGAARQPAALLADRLLEQPPAPPRPRRGSRAAAGRPRRGRPTPTAARRASPRGTRTRRSATAAGGGCRARRARSRRPRARATGRRAAPADRRSRARARAGRACSSSRWVMKPSLVRSGSNSRFARRRTRADGSSAASRSSDASSAGETGVRREEWVKACAASRRRSRAAAAARSRGAGERAGQRLGADLRVAVHVRARPRAEATSRPSTRTSKQRSSSSSTSGTASCSVASKKNRLRRTSSSTIGRTRRTSSVCHQQRQRLAQLGQQRAAARAADARVVERVEQPGDVQLVVEHRAPRRLRRVRGEDELDVQRAHRGGEVGARGAQQVGGLHQRLALAHAGGVVVAPPPDPLALLGDVGELELQRARADARLHVLAREAVHALDERGARVEVALAHVGGGLVQPADGVGEAPAALLHEHVVQHVREQLRVARERVSGLRWGGGDRHAPDESATERPRRRGPAAGAIRLAGAPTGRGPPPPRGPPRPPTRARSDR